MAVDIGTATNLVGGELICRIPQGAKFWFIQNQSISPLEVTMIGARAGSMTKIVLCPASSEGGAGGGELNSIAFPYFDTEGFLLESATPAGQFGSGWSKNQPVNVYPYPGSTQSA